MTEDSIKEVREQLSMKLAELFDDVKPIPKMLDKQQMNYREGTCVSYSSF